jgi:hypothetical protein
MKKVLLKNPADFAVIRDEEIYGDTMYQHESEPRSYPAMAVVVESSGKGDWTYRYVVFVYPAEFL